jgi:hypothetical protein
MKKVVLVVGGLLLLCFISVVVVVLVISKGSIINNGVPMEKVNFSSGGFGEADVIYPNSNQETSSEGVSIPDEMKKVVNTNQWKRFVTSDSKDTITQYYDSRMPSLGFSKGQTKEPGILVYTTGNTRFFIYILEVDGKNNIIIGLGKE